MLQKILFITTLLLLVSCISIQKETITLRVFENVLITHEESFSRYPETLYQKGGDERNALEIAYSGSLEELRESYQKYSTSIKRFTGSIEYFDAPKPMPPLGLIGTGNMDGSGNVILGKQIEDSGSYHEVGKLVLKDGRMGRLFFIRTGGIYAPTSIYYFIELGGQYYFLPSISYDMLHDDTDTVGKILQLRRWGIQRSDVHLFEEALFLPIFGDGYRLSPAIMFEHGTVPYRLTLIGRHTDIFPVSGIQKLDIVTFGKNLFIGSVTSSGIYAADALYVEMPDYTTALYELQIPFLQEKEGEGSLIVLRDYDGKIRQLKNYGYQEKTGCGIRDGSYAFVPEGKFVVDEYSYKEAMIRKKKLSEDEAYKNGIQTGDFLKERTITYQEDDLAPIGTASGETLLFFKDKNHPFLRAMYEYQYMDFYAGNGCFGDHADESCKSMLSFEKYRETLPIFFWRDPFGRLILFANHNTIAPSACGAKPVIYLYPREETSVRVTLNWKKKLLTSIPEYGNGWNVIAKPDGKIIQNGNTYPYLFWEELITYPKPETGFLVEREDVMDFLDEKLTFLGLSSIEIKDFIEYWIPHMQEYPYYRISFLTTDQMQISAPITVTPKPDSIQRVFMDFEGLREPRDIEPQVLTPFTRTGFSVIEWGGKKQ